MARRPLELERFLDRVDWLIHNAEPDERYAEVVLTRDDLVQAIGKALGPGNASPKMFNRHGKDGKTSWEVCKGLLEVYPEVPEDVLLAPRYDTFLQYAEPIKLARERWTKAARKLAKDRYELGKVAKRYYESVDETREFPSIGRSAWLLPKPYQLTEQTPLPELRMTATPPTLPRLPGLDINFHTIRARLMQKDQRPKNNPSYATLDIAVKDGRLQPTFGPLDYFQFLDTGEAIGAELADYVLNNEGIDPPPGALPLRGDPDQVYDFRLRGTYSSVVCLLIKKSSGVVHTSRRPVHKFVLHRRSNKTLQSPNMRAVFPAGGHQPLAADYGEDSERSLWHSVVKEFCEELFSKEEADRIRDGEHLFLEHKDVKPLVDAIFRSGLARVYLLGATLDPVTLGCDYLCTIVADWDKIPLTYTANTKLNYEGEISHFPLTKTRLQEEATRENRTKPMSPSSATCLLLARAHYDFLIAG